MVEAPAVSFSPGRQNPIVSGLGRVKREDQKEVYIDESTSNTTKKTARKERSPKKNNIARQSCQPRLFPPMSTRAPKATSTALA